MGKKIGIGVVGALIVFIMAYGMGIINFDSNANPSSTTLAEGIVPAFVDQVDAGWVLNPESAATDELVIWEDPQCPACAVFEAAYGPTIKQLIADDVIKVKIRPTTFLDRAYPGDFSTRAVNAWACAIEAGVGEAYHDYMYRNQPAVEGEGWTEQQLKDFATSAGATGAAKTKFDTCLVEGTYNKWATESTKFFDDLAIPGTPNVSINGVEVPTSVLQEGPSAFAAWVQEQLAK